MVTSANLHVLLQLHKEDSNLESPERLVKVELPIFLWMELQGNQIFHLALLKAILKSYQRRVGFYARQTLILSQIDRSNTLAQSISKV